MRTQTCETPIEQNEERLALERLYRSLGQRLQRPAEDAEICSEMNITLDEFHQMLDRMKGLNLGSFQEIKSEKSDEMQIRYLPDASQPDSSFLFRKSEIREILARAIDALPETERLITSLCYYDELSLKEIEAVLGIKGGCLLQLQTKATLRLRSRLSEAPWKHRRPRRLNPARRRRSQHAVPAA
jgi:RNA polymerase sigma factor for flagellar operon FliA